MTEAKRLTKAQRAFFEPIAKEMVTAMLYIALEDDDFEEVKDLVEEVDLQVLTEQVGLRYLEGVSFTDLKRVQKFTSEEPYKAVVKTGAEVGEAVKDLLVEAMRDVILSRATK